MQQAEQLKRANPALHAKISSNLMELERALDPDQAKAIEYGLVYYPEAMWSFAVNLSDESDGTTMADKIYRISQETPQQMWGGVVQGAGRFQQEKYIQQRILQDRVEQGRRMTKAPPPIVPPRGTASVPRDLYKTAEKGNAEDYVRLRRAQMARDAKDA
jgi:hypothetical protein